MHKARLEHAVDLFTYTVSSRSFTGVATDYTTYALIVGDLERARTVDLQRDRLAFCATELLGHIEKPGCRSTPDYDLEADAGVEPTPQGL